MEVPRASLVEAGEHRRKSVAPISVDLDLAPQTEAVALAGIESRGVCLSDVDHHIIDAFAILVQHEAGTIQSQQEKIWSRARSR